jgi:hypothetical protein
VAAEGGLEVWLSRAVGDPASLELTLRRFPRRLAACANGCAVAR